jgi:hypothetical protein
MDGSENISIIASSTGPKLDKPQPRSSHNPMRQEVTKDAFTLVLTHEPDYPADAVSKRPETAEAARQEC